MTTVNSDGEAQSRQHNGACFAWLTLLAIVLPVSVGCTTSLTQHTPDLCRPVCFECGVYDKKCPPDICSDEACCQNR